MDFQDIVLTRFTIHKIFGRRIKNTKEVLPYSEDCKDFCKIETDGIDTLAKRVIKAVSHKRKFFELDIHETNDESFWKLASPMIGSNKNTFLTSSNLLAQKMAIVHDRAGTPDGLLLVVDAVISGLKSLVIIKAEKSNAFSMAGSNMQLVKDIFLSSDKALYKIGLLIHKDNKNNTVNSYKGYVFDDAFTPSKENLAIYFYERFLGFSAEKNGPLKTNELYNDLKDFNNSRIDNLSDRNDISRNIDRKLMSKKIINIHADDFKVFFPEDIHSEFEHYIVSKFPFAIVKDISLLGDFLTKKIKITSDADLIAKNGISDKVKYGHVRNGVEKPLKEIKLDTGLDYKTIYVPITTNIVDTTADTISAPKRKKK